MQDMVGILSFAGSDPSIRFSVTYTYLVDSDKRLVARMVWVIGAVWQNSTQLQKSPSQHARRGWYTKHSSTPARTPSEVLSDPCLADVTIW